MYKHFYVLEAIDNGWVITYPNIVDSVPYEYRVYLPSIDEVVEFIKNNEKRYYQQQPQVKES